MQHHDATGEAGTRSETPASSNSRLRLSIAERRAVLQVVDVLAIQAAFVFSLWFRHDIKLSLDILVGHYYWFIMLTGIWLACGTLLNLYDVAAIHRHPNAGLVPTISAIGMTALVFLFVPYLTPELPKSRILMVPFPVAALVLILAWRYFYYLTLGRIAFSRQVLVVGCDEAGKTLAAAIAEYSGADRSEHGVVYNLIGFTDDRVGSVDSSFEGFPILGSSADLLKLVERHRPDEIVLASRDPRTLDDRTFQAILSCRERGFAVSTTIPFYENLTQRLPGELVGNNIALVLPSPSSGQRFYRLATRIFDLAISLIGCLLVLVVLPFLWLANKIFSPGPLFYSQERVGQSGRVFRLHKFRSMIVDAEKETGPVWAAHRDTRVTQLGRFLRRSRLDELPQFWDVLRGEMSLIGPRPERPELVGGLEDISYYRLRHAVRPGITGWAQVKYPYGGSKRDAEMKLKYDLYYIKHQNFRLDLLILFKTIRVILLFKGV